MDKISLCYFALFTMRRTGAAYYITEPTNRTHEPERTWRHASEAIPLLDHWVSRPFMIHEALTAPL
jgi:hypothetical protein